MGPWRTSLPIFKYVTLLIFFCLCQTSFAALEIEEAEVVPQGLPQAEYLKLLSQKNSLDQERESILADIETLNTNCSQVSSKDKDKIEACRLRHDLISQRMSRYEEKLEDYEARIKQAQQSGEYPDSSVVDLRDAKTDVVNIDVVKGNFTKSEPVGLPLMERASQADLDWLNQKREEVAKEEQVWRRKPDPETRLINPLWLEEITITFNLGEQVLEDALKDPRLQEINSRSMALEKEKQDIDKEFFSTLNKVKDELKPKYLGQSDQWLDLKALEDPRVTAVSKRSMAFDRALPERRQAVRKEFFSTLETVKKELTDKNAEQILRQRWRQENQP
jgi:hypothetical protein